MSEFVRSSEALSGRRDAAIDQDFGSFLAKFQKISSASKSLRNDSYAAQEVQALLKVERRTLALGLADNFHSDERGVELRKLWAHYKHPKLYLAYSLDTTS